jgi:FixJ family two-component response regulator
VERGQHTVAVIEDDSSMRKSIERLLNAYGFSVEAFASAEAFLERRLKADYGCAVLDIHLPGMSGFELSRELTGTQRTLPIIFVTAMDDDRVRDEASRVGCVAYLRKPYAPEQLLHAVRRAVGAAAG